MRRTIEKFCVGARFVSPRINEAVEKALSPPGRGFGRGGRLPFSTLSPILSLKERGFAAASQPEG